MKGHLSWRPCRLDCGNKHCAEGWDSRICSFRRVLFAPSFLGTTRVACAAGITVTDTLSIRYLPPRPGLHRHGTRSASAGHCAEPGRVDRGAHVADEVIVTLKLDRAAR